MMKKKYSFFIKFGNKINMQSLLDEGEIYCNTISFFENAEQNTAMTDIHEGAYRIIQGKNLKLKVGETILTSDTVQQVIKQKELTGNLFCFYGYESKNLTQSSNEEKLDIDISGIDWGDTAVLILDTLEFMRRMDNKINELKYAYKISPVIYYDFKNFNGNLTIFHKRKFPYEKQSEIRYFIESKEKTIIKFNIGSISDIAVLIPKSKLNEITYTLD